MPQHQYDTPGFTQHLHVRDLPSHRLRELAEGLDDGGVSRADARAELDRRHHRTQELTCRMLDRFSECISARPLNHRL